MKKFYALLISSVFGIYAFAGTYDLELTGLNMKSVSVVNHDVTISGTVMNAGTETIHSFTLSWNDGSQDHSTMISGLSIMPGATYTFTHPVTFKPAMAKKYDLTVEVSSPDGNADVTAADNKMSKTVHGTSREAVKRAVAEEATGTWCGFCPRGAVFMDMEREEYGDMFIGIAVHNSDPMTISSYDADITSYPGFTGFPNVVLDRDLLIDPSALPTKVPTRLDNDAVADINVHGYYDETESVLHVTVTAEFLSADDGLDYRLNVILTEDGVTGTSSGYAQENYYAGGGYGPLYGWEDLTNPVPASDMVYDFVARISVDDWEGTDGSVPSVVTEGLYVTYDYEIDIDEDWNIDNLNVIGLLTDHDNDDEILNGNSSRLTDLTLSASDISAASEIKMYPNPAVDNTVISLNLASASELTMQIADISGNIVSEKNYGLQSGTVTLPVNTADFASGIYVVNIIAGNEISSRKLNIIR